MTQMILSVVMVIIHLKLDKVKKVCPDAFFSDKKNLYQCGFRIISCIHLYVIVCFVILTSYFQLVIVLGKAGMTG